MTLSSLLSCDIYRDGGSLEAVWQTDEGKEWVLTLRIDSWDHPNDPKTYQLYRGRLKELKPHERIEKGSAEHLQIMELIRNWKVPESGIPETDRFSLEHLLDELEKRNY